MTATFRGMKRLAALAVILAVALLGARVSAASDFTQAKRDADFLKSARRQDAELLKFYGNQVPAGIRFCHIGSFKAIVHRHGLDRPITLVPAEQMRFADATALKEEARGGDLIVGAIKLTYGSVEPELVPGTILLLYDGLRVHLKDTHGTDVARFDASIGSIPAGTVIDNALGELDKVDHSVATIQTDGTFKLYLQLADSKGNQLMDGANYKKVLLQFSIPGIVDDDDSPPTVLAQPKEPAKGTKPASGSKKDSGGSSGGGGHHH